jgi:hypothetical protein
MNLFQTSVEKKFLDELEFFKIEKTDKEIDQMKHEVYGLTEEEIKIMEGAV